MNAVSLRGPAILYLAALSTSPSGVQELVKIGALPVLRTVAGLLPDDLQDMATQIMQTIEKS
jgi:hypothetical protein